MDTLAAHGRLIVKGGGGGDERTMTLVRMQKKRKVRWATVPHRAFTISRMVCALGAFRFTSTARIPKRRICTVAPDAYLNKFQRRVSEQKAENVINLSAVGMKRCNYCGWGKRKGIMARGVAGRQMWSVWMWFDQWGSPEGSADTILPGDVGGLQQSGGPGPVGIHRTVITTAYLG